MLKPGFFGRLYNSCIFQGVTTFRPFSCRSSVESSRLLSCLVEKCSGEVESNEEEDFVLHGFHREKRFQKLEDIPGAKRNESDVDKLSEVLKRTHGSVEEVQRELDGFGYSRVSHEMVEQILRRFNNDWISALGFFKWVQDGGKYRHTENAYNMMVDILGKTRQFQLMWELMEKMRQTGLITLMTFVKVMRRYAGVNRWRDVTMAFYRLEEFGLKADTDAMNAFLDSFCKEWRVDYAWDIFQDLKSKIPPNAHTFNVLIHGWCKAKRFDEAEWTMKEMRKHGFQPCVISYTCLVEAACHQLDFRKVYTLLDEMQRNGCPPNVVTYTTVMHSLGKAKKIQEALKIYNRMKANGCSPDVSFYNTLIRTLETSGRIKVAYEVFLEMSKQGFVPNVKTYNNLLSGFCELLQEEKAFSVFNEMEANNCRPTIQSYNLLLKMCCKLKRIKIIAYLLDDMVTKDCSPDFGTYTLLVHGLCRSEKLKSACHFLDLMVSKKMIPKASTFSLLLNALEEAGYNEERARIVELMKEAERMKQLRK